MVYCIIIRHFIISLGRFRVSDECLKQKLDMKTPIVFFLCKLEGEGSGFMAMIDFLAFYQNEFLTQYKNTQGAVIGHSSLLKVTDTHLISYSSNADLLPLLFTHCDYSLELGKGYKIKYNFEKILRSLMDKVFYSKSTLEIQ